MTISEWPTAPTAQTVDLTAKLHEDLLSEDDFDDELADFQIAPY